MAVPGATAGGVPYPNLADPAVAQQWADQAVAGGNPYFQGPGSPQASPQGRASASEAATRLQAPAPTAPAPVPYAPYNPSGDYAAQFEASLGTQRSALDNALHTSLSQLAGRRDAASHFIGTIPAQVQGEFKAANARAANVQGHADKAVGTGAPGGAVGGDLNAGLYQQDLSQNMAASKNVEPLLQLGATANYDLGEAGLNQAHLSGVSALEAQQAQFDAQMAGQQQQNAFTAGESQKDRDFQAAHTAPAESFQQKAYLAGIDPATGVPYNVEASAGKTDPKTGLTAYQQAEQYNNEIKGAAKTAGMNTSQYQAAIDSPQFKQYVARLQAYGKDSRNTADEPVALLKELHASGDTTTAKVLFAAGLVTAEQVAAAAK